MRGLPGIAFEAGAAILIAVFGVAFFGLTSLAPRLVPARSGAPLSCPADTPPPSGGQDLWVSTSAAAAATWSCPVNLGPRINSAANDLRAAFSDDGELLLFSSNRSGGMGSDDLWMSRREPQKHE